MNKQKRALELLAIFLLIAILGTIVWTSNPYSSGDHPNPKSGDNAASPSGPAHVTSPDEKKWAEGRSLFKSNCAACHNPKVAQTGPALMGVTKRWEEAGTYQGKTGTEWLHVWIKDWNKAVASGYPYALQIERYNDTHMNTFPNLKDEEIDAILSYVETDGTAKAQMP